MSNFVLPDVANGKKLVDLLDVDKPVAGQQFVCVSFVSPEKILKIKSQFFFEEFLKVWDFTTSMNKFRDFLKFMTEKHPTLKLNSVMEDYNDFIKEESVTLCSHSVKDDYTTFIEQRESVLEAKFKELYPFQTSTRGIKIRGSYSTKEEADQRVSMLRQTDINHDIFVGEVGYWIPWDPDAYKTGETIYMEEELNKLMHGKIQNDANVKASFEERIMETKRQAIEENVKNAQRTGAKLTQTIDEDGQLVGLVNQKV